MHPKVADWPMWSSRFTSGHRVNTMRILTSQAAVLHDLRRAAAATSSTGWTCAVSEERCSRASLTRRWRVLMLQTVEAVIEPDGRVIVKQVGVLSQPVRERVVGQ